MNRSDHAVNVADSLRDSVSAARTRAGVALAVFCLLATSVRAQTSPQLPPADPADAGMSADRLAVIDEIVAQGIRRDEMPGAVVLVGRQGRIVFERAYGHRQIEPEPVAMTVDTLFDLASLTKPIATATTVMRLLERGDIELRQPVAEHIPEFGTNGKDEITIYHLLTHQGGLTPDNALRDYDDGVETAFDRIHALELTAPPRERFIYSDVGFIMLGELVERLSGQPLNEFAGEQIFEPLGMHETGYLPGEELRNRAAPTEQRDGEWMRGEVHDPRSFRLGGVAGHAGLFSTAHDLARYAQMMLNGGSLGDVRVLEEETVALMTRGYDVPGDNLRGLGWDVRSGYSSNRGDLMSASAFGHGGFTGTAIWIDPELELFVIFLSNRLHPDGEGSVNRLAGRIGTVAAGAILSDARLTRRPQIPVADVDVLTGIDVLERDQFSQLADKRIGLITNHTGLCRDGVSTVTLLHEAENVELKVLFSPEHGFEGKLDTSIVDNAEDPDTGLTIISLYGETRKPPAESLSEIDALVFDIQDIGTRFYTYISTMGLAMQAAADAGIEFVVLDRPNPINGVDVAGPVLDDGLQSFVGYHTIPVRHGMTVGELARMFQAELELDLELTVIPVEGWQREQFYDATGLTWTNPSPNMRSLNEAVLYPGIGLLETTNLSVGRGTDTPFEVIGAPWLDGRVLAEALNRSRLPGVRFVPVRFTPEASRFADEECGGVNIIVTDRAAFEPVRTGLMIAHRLLQTHPQGWDPANFNRLLGNERTYREMLGGEAVDEVEINWRPELEEFRERRAEFLLY